MGHRPHAHGPDGLDFRLWVSIGLNLGIALVESAGGLLAGSLALLADAMHNLADAGALGVAILARQLGRRAPTTNHTYGFRRAEVIAALLNAGILIAISVLIAREALSRLFHPMAVRTSIMLISAMVALGANSASVLLLRRHSHEDINVRSAFLHLLQDALASLAVVIAALLAQTRIGAYVDPAAAILIGVVVLRSAASIVWQSLHTLLEGTPPDLSIAVLADAVSSRFPQVRLHHVHVWEVGPGQRLLTAHMKTGLGRISDAEALASNMRRYLHDEWGITHVTLEAEVNGCGNEEILGAWN